MRPLILPTLTALAFTTHALSAEVATLRASDSAARLLHGSRLILGKDLIRESVEGKQTMGFLQQGRLSSELELGLPACAVTVFPLSSSWQSRIESRIHMGKEPDASELRALQPGEVMVLRLKLVPDELPGGENETGGTLLGFESDRQRLLLTCFQVARSTSSGFLRTLGIPTLKQLQWILGERIKLEPADPGTLKASLHLSVQKIFKDVFTADLNTALRRNENLVQEIKANALIRSCVATRMRGRRRILEGLSTCQEAMDYIVPAIGRRADLALDVRTAERSVVSYLQDEVSLGLEKEIAEEAAKRIDRWYAIFAAHHNRSATEFTRKLRQDNEEMVSRCRSEAYRHRAITDGRLKASPASVACLVDHVQTVLVPMSRQSVQDSLDSLEQMITRDPTAAD